MRERRQCYGGRALSNCLPGDELIEDTGPHRVMPRHGPVTGAVALECRGRVDPNDAADIRTHRAVTVSQVGSEEETVARPQNAGRFAHNEFHLSLEDVAN